MTLSVNDIVKKEGALIDHHLEAVANILSQAGDGEPIDNMILLYHVPDSGIDRETLKLSIRWRRTPIANDCKGPDLS